jgi:hypothetical protein
MGTEGGSVVSGDEDSTVESDIRDSEAYTDTQGVFAEDVDEVDSLSEAWKGSVIYAA